jgi:hypothetical protein
MPNKLLLLRAMWTRKQTYVFPKYLINYYYLADRVDEQNGYGRPLLEIKLEIVRT